MTRVGFIGLGSQGGPMARRIVDEGFPLTIWARRRESVRSFDDTAASVVSSPAQVGEASDIVGICVFSDADVEDVLLRPDGVLAGMSPGGVVAIHSTVHPDTSARMAREASTRGVSVIDAPVSGGGDAAAGRRLLLMAGGDEKEVARCRPVFEAFADPVVYLGPIGSGQIAKAINNLLLAAHMSIAIEAFSFAGNLQLDCSALAEALAHGTGGSKAAGMVAASGFDADYLRDNSAKYFSKDLDIMTGIADSRGVARPDSLLEVARRALPHRNARADDGG
jgi:3-hydroxyisobutyrate dehydrogenase-like beta-hydroxyacid dehydrogenase